VIRAAALGERRSDRGFTLLELLVVLAVLALTAAVMLPALTGGDGVELRTTAREVAAALRYARSRALTENRDAAFEVDVEANRMTSAGVRSRRIPAGVALGLYTARSELIGERAGAIRFFPDGSSTGGRVTVAARSAAAVAYYVDVDWLTGGVRVLEGAPPEPGARP